MHFTGILNAQRVFYVVIIMIMIFQLFVIGRKLAIFVIGRELYETFSYELRYRFTQQSKGQELI